MKYTVSFICSLLLFSNVFGQIIVADPPTSQTINYSYDDQGNLIKNFDLNETINIDSLKQCISGKWTFSKYTSWEKQSKQVTPTIIEFKDGIFNQLQGVYHKQTKNIKGTYEVKPYRDNSVAISISIESSSSPSLTKLKLIAVHCQPNILFFVIKEYHGESMTYRGIFKMKRTH